MAWEILGTLGQQDPPGLDASLWLFEVKRGTERRRVEVLISGPAKHSEVPHVRRAVETSGQSALVDALEEIGDREPPKRITITGDGIDY
jgi:hypothetical protein